MSEEKKQLTPIEKVNELLTNKLESDIEAFPKGFNLKRFQKNAMMLLNNDEKLKEAALTNKQGFVLGIARGGYLGLDFNNKECYLIPYKNDKTGRYDINFQTDYKGERKICKKYSTRPVLDIYAKVVREGDEFEEGIDHGKQYINFKPLPFNNNKEIGVFAVVYYQDGGMSYETMSKADVEYIRNNFSKMANGPSWKKSFTEMMKKTAMRRLCKSIDLDFDSIEQAQAWEESSDMNFEQEEKKEVVKSDLEKELELENEIEEVIETDFEVVEDVE